MSRLRAGLQLFRSHLRAPGGSGRSPSPAWAQLTRGIISGSVSRYGGGVLPGRDGDDHQSGDRCRSHVRSPTTRASIAPRRSSLASTPSRPSSQGFKSFETRDIRVASGQEVDPQRRPLTVGGLEETVQVTAEQPVSAINRTNATVGLVMPARGRSSSFRFRRPATSRAWRCCRPTSCPALAPRASRPTASARRNNNFMIDGSDNNDASVTHLDHAGACPRRSAEIAVQTNPYNVEYGRSSGAQFNVITKSGTNAFRGDVFDYYANSKYNARSNVEKRTGFDEPAGFTRHQVGGGIGGPIAAQQAVLLRPVPGRHPSRGRRARHRRPTSRRRPATPRCRTCRCAPARRAASRAAVLNSHRLPAGRLRAESGVHRTCAPRRSTACRSRSARSTCRSSRIVTPTTRSAAATGRCTGQRHDHGSLHLRPADDAERDQQPAVRQPFRRRVRPPRTRTSRSATPASSARSKLNEFRFSYIRRDLSFPEADPVTPTTTLTGLFTIGGLSATSRRAASRTPSSSRTCSPGRRAATR